MDANYIYIMASKRHGTFSISATYTTRFVPDTTINGYRGQAAVRRDGELLTSMDIAVKPRYDGMKSC